MMLFKRICPAALLAVLASSSVVKRATVDTLPLLTVISKDPELSIFYSLINSTGGTSGIPGPPFEERFNVLADRRKYTVFAPVNSAFEALQPELAASLTTPASYVLLKAILGTHIAEGLVTTEEVRNSEKPVISIEGIPLKFTSEGNATTINNQARFISTQGAIVGNGAIFKITSVIDPLVSLFGTDVTKNGSTIAPTRRRPAKKILAYELRPSGTVASALSSLPDISTYVALLKATSPAFFTFLDSPLPAGKHMSIFAPSNAALAAVGQGAKAVQPTNQPFTSYLLEYLFIDTTSAGSEKSIVGFPAVVRRDGDGAIASVNNAAVKREPKCVGDACVYVMDRWLDPVFGSL